MKLEKIARLSMPLLLTASLACSPHVTDDVAPEAGIEFRLDDRFALEIVASRYRFEDLDFGTAALSLKLRF